MSRVRSWLARLRWVLSLSRHGHFYEVAAVQTRPGGNFLVPAQGSSTVVLYRCACDQPGSLVTVELMGRWTLEQVTGREPVPSPEEQEAAVSAA